MPAAEYHTYARKVLTAARKTDTMATESQREAGNFAVGKVYAHGLELAIEYPKGSIRRGKGKDGKAWARVMSGHYGRINRTLSAHDGDPVDFFMGEHPESQIVFVVSQLTEEGNLDEHKCILGTRNVAEAKKLYLAHYPAGWADERMGEVRGYTMPQFKAWLKSNSPVKAKVEKQAGWFCRGCNEFVKDRDEADGCPTCDDKKEAMWRVLAASVFGS